MKPLTIIRVPVPPSANQMWRKGKGRFYLSPKYEAWLKEFGWEWLADKPKGFKTITTKYLLHVSAPRTRKDLDNLVKPINDALQKFHIVSNDKNCVEGHIVLGRSDDTVTIYVEPIP